MTRTINFFKYIESPTKRFLIYLIWVLLITGYWLPRNWSFFGGEDWDLTYTMFEVARKSLAEYGQWPQFNPWISMGSDLNSNPQSMHMGIFFLPVLVFGTFYGYKLSIIFAILIGLAGSFRLFRHISGDDKPAFINALLFTSSAYFSSHIFIAGHSNTLFIYLIPWFVFLLLKLREKQNLRYLLFSVFILSQMIWGGAPVVFIMAVIAGIGSCTADSVISKNHKQWLVLLITTFLAIAVSLWKILPAMALWEQSPRHITDNSSIHPVQWLQSLAGFTFRTGQWHGPFEYHLGLNLFILFLLISYRSQIPGWKFWAAGLLIIIWFCLGNFPPYVNPWYLLNHYVPPFTSIRAPSRFGILVVLALYAGFARIYAVAGNRNLMNILVASLIATNYLAFRAEVSSIEDTPQVEPEIVFNYNDNATPRIKKVQANEHTFPLVKQNYSIPNAYEPLNLPEVKDTLNRFVSGARLTRFSPCDMQIKMEDSLATFNLRYSEYWKVDDDADIHQQRGLLQIRSHHGKKLNLHYKNTDLLKGIYYSLSFFPLLLLGHFALKKSHKKTL